MDADILITQLRSKRAYIFVDNNELVIRVPPAVMTPEIIADIRNHKSEIINHLKTANDEAPKKYAYHFELKNNAGAGTWITEKPPTLAKSDLQAFYIGREIEEFELIN